MPSSIQEVIQYGVVYNITSDEERDLLRESSSFSSSDESIQVLSSPESPITPSHTVSNVHNPIPLTRNFTFEHLNLKYLVTGIKKIAEKRRLVREVQAWIRTLLIREYRIHKRPSSSTFRSLLNGPYYQYNLKICQVQHCKNSQCTRKHSCLICATMYNLEAEDHQYGESCPIHQLLKITLCP